MITFHIPIVPKAQRRARHGRLNNGHSITYKDSAQRQAEGDLISLMRPYVPEKPFEKNVTIDIVAVFPTPKSWSKKKKNDPGAMITKPDVDNLIKQVLDCMTILRFWNDDCQVDYIGVSKHYESEELKVGWYIDIYT